jgi:hypothetical protein
MIEIKCNKTEQIKLIEALKVMESPCLFPRKAAFCALDASSDCKKCLKEKIKWVIK